ncbi:DUF1129 domain-containing protein [Enterococcus sp. LJL120]
MEPEKLREFVSENRQWEEQLTKRNEQYIFDLKKSMNAANLSEADQAEALHDILPTLVEGQKKGITARQLYGTVSESVEQIMNKPKESKVNAPVMMWLDNFLLFLGIFAAIFGLMNQFAASSNSGSFGLVTLIVGAAAGGWVMYLMYKYVYQYDRPGADKSKKPKMWKSMLLMVGATLIWLVAFTASGLLPAVINPVLDPIVMLVLGAAVLGLRWYLKKRLGIVGMFSMR